MKQSLYTRPNKPRRIEVKKREDAPEMARDSLPELLEVDAYSECHITPQPTGEDMASYLYDADGLILEPQAGTGELIEALNFAGYDLKRVVAVERNIKLMNSLHDRFEDNLNEIVSDCFLEFAHRVQGRIFYPNIIMNPPFKAVKKHMKAAISLLSRTDSDACLVALVPVTYEHPKAELIETLPDTTFSTAKVNTKIIRIFGCDL